MATSVEIYLACVSGIVISVVLPILIRALPEAPAGGSVAAAEPRWLAGLWEQAKPYLVTGLFSALAAFLIIAYLGEHLKDWRSALLAGYAWDSTIQKVRKQ